MGLTPKERQRIHEEKARKKLRTQFERGVNNKEISYRNIIVGCLVSIIILFLIGLLSSLSLQSQVNSSTNYSNIVRKSMAEQGRKLHLKILRRHPKIDQIYERPSLWGGFDDTPLVFIIMPEKDWNSISEKKRNLLCAYVASLVNQNQLTLFSYTRIPENAPVAPIIKQNILKMTDKSWGIMAGRISKDGRDIYTDKLVETGQK